MGVPCSLCSWLWRETILKNENNHQVRAICSENLVTFSCSLTCVAADENAGNVERYGRGAEGLEPDHKRIISSFFLRLALALPSTTTVLGKQIDRIQCLCIGKTWSLCWGGGGVCFINISRAWSGSHKDMGMLLVPIYYPTDINLWLARLSYLFLRSPGDEQFLLGVY